MIELYYKNCILINIEIPNFEEIKKKYFDNEENKIVLLNDNYSIQSPFEYFIPVMYSDESGHFLILALLIGIGIGALIGGVGAGVSSYKDGNRGQVLIGDILGGALVRGALGAASTLGGLAGAGYIGLKAAALGGTTATLFSSTGLSLSMGSAIGIGSGFALATGMAGYTTRALISRSESYSIGNMLLEGGMNAVSGALSVLWGALGGYAGVHNTILSLSNLRNYNYEIIILHI